MLLSGWVTPIAVDAEHWDEDGWSFGVGADTGWVYSARVRPATIEEYDAVIARDRLARQREHQRERRRELSAALLSLCSSASLMLPGDQPAGSVPDNAVREPLTLIRGDSRELWVDERAGLLWTASRLLARDRDLTIMRCPITAQRRMALDAVRAAHSDA